MLDADPSLKAGELWMLKRLNGLSPDADLKRLVDRAVRDLAGHKSARLVDPKAPKTALPADPGRGLIKFMYYVLAPIGVPESRAEAFIRDFLSQPGTGYVLTHQFLVLEWAGETGLAVPESLREKKDGLLERIAAEQASGTQFSDLFAERASILFAFSAVPPETAAGWVETILAAQAADGRWLDTKSTPLTYDGQNATAMHPWGHTTGFAAAAIGFYLQRYGVG